MTIAEILKDKYTVCHPPYMGNERTYVTYQCMGQIGTLYADGVEKETGVMYAVDYYTNNPPFKTAVDDIKNKLAAAGWNCSVDTEIYETDTGLYHIAMTAVNVGGIYG